jgi:hypothetical protein
MDEAQWLTFIEDLDELLFTASNNMTGEWSQFAKDLTNLLQQIIPNLPLEARMACNRLTIATPNGPNPTVRDWSGFFAAIANLLKTLLPIIIPLIGGNTHEPIG